MARSTRRGSVPRGFRVGATLQPDTTPIARLYAERVDLFDQLIEGEAVLSSEDLDRLASAVFALDRRILEAPPSRLADLGVKARILRALAAGLGDEGSAAPRLGFEALVVSFLIQVETTLGSSVEKAAGIAAH